MTIVTIVYRSGAKVHVECEGCEVEKDGPKLTRITVTKGKPRPLHFGIDEIAAVWEGEA